MEAPKTFVFTIPEQGTASLYLKSKRMEDGRQKPQMLTVLRRITNHTRAYTATPRRIPSGKHFCTMKNNSVT